MMMIWGYLKEVDEYYERLKSNLKTYQMLLVKWKKGLLIACHVRLLVLLIAEVSGAYPYLMDLVYLNYNITITITIFLLYSHSGIHIFITIDKGYTKPPSPFRAYTTV